jgi:hypothetical protein
LLGGLLWPPSSLSSSFITASFESSNMLLVNLIHVVV